MWSFSYRSITWELFGVKGFNFFYFITKKVNPKRVVGITGKDLYDITLDAESTGQKLNFGAGIQTLNQAMQQLSSG